MLGEIIGHIPETGYVLIEGSDGYSYHCLESDIEIPERQSVELGMALDFIPVNTGFERKACQGKLHVQYQFEVISPPFVSEGGLPDGLSLYYLHPVPFSVTGSTKQIAKMSLIGLARRCGINAILNQTVIKSITDDSCEGDYIAQGNFAVVTKRGYTAQSDVARQQSIIVAKAIREAERLTRQALYSRTLSQKKPFYKRSVFQSMAAAIMGR